MTSWRDVKLWVLHETGLPDSTVHVLAGMLVLFAAAALLRRVPWDWRPWLLVTLAEVANELYDLSDPRSGEATLRGSFQDLWLTLACPTLLVLLVPPLVLLAATRRSVPDGEGAAYPAE